MSATELRARRQYASEALAYAASAAVPSLPSLLTPARLAARQEPAQDHLSPRSCRSLLM